MIGLGSAESSQRFAGGLSQIQFLGIVCLFWVYVTVSNVLYGYSMRAGIARVTDVTVFASWDTRLLQHLLLLPMLLVSFWASLKVQWRPVLIALPLQVVLGAVFSAMAYPVMILSEVIMAADQSHGTALSHVVSAWSDPFWVTLWLASFVSFLPSYGFGLALVTGLALYTRFRDSELRLPALGGGGRAARVGGPRLCGSPRWSASGAPRGWRPCACSSRRILCSICCIPSAATSSGIRRRRSPWWCSSPICCGACSTPASGIFRGWPTSYILQSSTSSCSSGASPIASRSSCRIRRKYPPCGCRV